MRYITNEKVKVGDIVILSDGSKGVVVCDFDENITIVMNISAGEKVI